MKEKKTGIDDANVCYQQFSFQQRGKILNHKEKCSQWIFIIAMFVN